jgi:hypothetical protein
MGVQLPIQNYFKPKPTPTDWVRPVDWITITDTANEVQFLVADIDLACFTIRTTFTRTTGNIYIDWGDGVTNTISTITTTSTSHTYAIGTGTPCSRGYTTFKIRVYGDPTCVITTCQPIAPVATSGSLAYNMGVLEVYYGNGTATVGLPNYSCPGNPGGPVGTFNYLEYVKLPATVGWTTYSYSFHSNISVQKIVMPTSGASLTALGQNFLGCTQLRELLLPLNATGITNLSGTFSGCTNLKTIQLPTTLNSLTAIDSTFTACNSLKNITLPALPLVTSFNQTFFGCTSLQWVRFTSLPTPASPGTAILFTGCFQNCYSLENIYFPASCSANAIYGCGNMFFNCTNLKSMVFPINFDASTISSVFNGCFSITSIIFQSGFTACTTMAIAFSSCVTLNSLTLPSTMGANVTMNNAFVSCVSLESIVIPSTYVIAGSVNSMCNSCTNLKTFSFPNNSQNLITTFDQSFVSCAKLETIILPTSMTGCTTLNQAFNGCNLLKSVTLPLTMNNVTTMATTFSNCFALTTVTLPTSMAACTVFSSTFQNCYSLTSVTLPATVSAVTTTWAFAFSGCSSLKTITLPTTQQTGLTTIASAFANCGTLTTINNLNKLGSLGATPLVAGGSNTGMNLMTTMSFSCPFSVLALNGASLTNFNKLNSLRLTNTSTGQWTGASPQINVNSCDLSTAALNTLFADMAAQGLVTAKTINITSCTGAAGLTPANRLVITSLGWTIIG